MTSDLNSDKPTNSAEQHSPTQPESSTSTPEQSKVRTKTENDANDQPTVAQEIRGEFRWFEFGSLFINGALVVVGMYALSIYNGKLTEMRKSTKAAQDAADAATSAANTAHDALVTSNRPWIGVEGVPVIQDRLHATHNRNELEYVVTIAARNYGPSPALHVNINPISEIDSSKNVKEFLERIKSAETASCSMADLGVIENRSQTVVSGRPETVIVPPTGPTLFPNDRFAFPSDAKVGYGGTEDVSQYRLRMNGCIAYSDQFGKIHHTRFCFYTPKAIKDFVPPQTLVSCNIGTQTAD